MRARKPAPQSFFATHAAQLQIVCGSLLRTLPSPPDKRRNPREPALSREPYRIGHRRLPPSHSSTAPPIFWRAHALPPLSPRPPARHPHSAGGAAQVISAPARRHLRPPRSGVFSSFPKGPRPYQLQDCRR
ncbi:hypothetical protein PAHAL_1G125500 [Panicum hallii]|uniref:Uncharacterized protein n=1 Tax=Panicum hallii TaxID=206008 RepID=A0A2T8KV05_9POAL|nr:hypothetical protein PAHAL_1G125500 [Panicum hallii]